MDVLRHGLAVIQYAPVSAPSQKENLPAQKKALEAEAKKHN